MSSKFWCLIFSTVAFVVSSELKFTVTKLECSCDIAITRDPVCVMEPLGNTGGVNISFGGVMLERADKVFVSFHNYVKFGRTGWKMGYLTTRLNVCELTNSIPTSFVRYFDTSLRDMKQHLHKCPYLPKKYLFEDVSITGEIFMKILRPGNYRFDYRTSNEKNQTIFDMRMYALIA